MKVIRIEMGENAFWFFVWTAGFAAAVAVSAIFTNGYNQRIKAAFKAGYSEQTLQGTPGVHWVKTK